jgi:hypothetical protein
MPKVKWGGKELQDSLENYDGENDAQYRPYDGPPPRAGMYLFTVKRVKQNTSPGGFPRLQLFLELTPRAGRPDEKRYDKFFMLDGIIVKEDGSTTFRVRPFLDAIGVSVREFMTNTVTSAEDNELVVKIGKFKTDKPFQIMGAIKPQKDSDYYEIKYYPMPEDADDDADDDMDDDDTKDDDAPF